MSGRRDSRKRSRGRARKRRQSRTTVRLIIFFVLILSAALLVKGFFLNRKIDANDTRARSLEAEIEAEKERTDHIKAQRDTISSNEVISQLAKDKLGLVESDEILFKSED
jgi:cell division protein DivIC